MKDIMNVNTKMQSIVTPVVHCAHYPNFNSHMPYVYSLRTFHSASHLKPNYSGIYISSYTLIPTIQFIPPGIIKSSQNQLGQKYSFLIIHSYVSGSCIFRVFRASILSLTSPFFTPFLSPYPIFFSTVSLGFGPPSPIY